MPTWIELDQQFRELQPALRFHRLDFQWGAAGVYYRLAGGGISDATRRFEALARIAGMKLQELPPGVVACFELEAEDPAERWYEALKLHSDAFEHDMTASQHDSDGTFQGHIYSGSIQNPAGVSGVFALQLSAVPIPAPPPPVDPPKGFVSRLNVRLSDEAHKRRHFWLVAGAIAALVLAGLALL